MLVVLFSVVLCYCIETRKRHTGVCRNEGMMVKVKVDVTKIVKYVCVTGISIVAIIFGAKCLRAYLQDEA